MNIEDYVITTEEKIEVQYNRLYFTFEDERSSIEDIKYIILESSIFIEELKRINNDMLFSFKLLIRSLKEAYENIKEEDEFVLIHLNPLYSFEDEYNIENKLTDIVG